MPDTGPDALPDTGPDVPAGGRYRHPLGWYEVAVPPGWVVDQAAEPARLVGPLSEAVAILSVAKTGGAELPTARCKFIRRAVPGMTAVARLGDAEGTRDGLSWARTDELLGKRLPWWRRLFQTPRPEVLLVTVCFTRGSLLVLMTFEVKPNRLDAHRLMIDAMIGSVRLPESPAPAPGEFVERFVRLCRERFPGRRFASTDQPLTVTVDGAELSLEQPYRAAVCDSELGDGAYESIFRYLGANPIPAPGTESFDDVRERILPAIKPRAWVRTADAKLPERHRLQWMPFPNDTAVVFVVDYSAAMRFVSRDEAERWEVPPKQMLGIARDNLQTRSREPREHLILDRDGNPHAIAVAEGDGYDAARLLLPGLRERLSARFGADFAVAIPNRDFLIAFRTDKLSVLRHMRKLIERDSARRPYPITDGLFQFTDDGILPYQVESSETEE